MDANAGKAPCARRLSEEFKRDAVRLVVKEGYACRAAAEAICGSVMIAEELAERDDSETACRNTVAATTSRLCLRRSPTL